MRVTTLKYRNFFAQDSYETFDTLGFNFKGDLLEGEIEGKRKREMPHYESRKI